MNLRDLEIACQTNKALAESDKAFDESISTLIHWLAEAVEKNYMSSEEAKKEFKEELKRREEQMKPTSD